MRHNAGSFHGALLASSLQHMVNQAASPVALRLTNPDWGHAGSKTRGGIAALLPWQTVTAAEKGARFEKGRTTHTATETGKGTAAGTQTASESVSTTMAGMMSEATALSPSTRASPTSHTPPLFYICPCLAAEVVLKAPKVYVCKRLLTVSTCKLPSVSAT